MSIYNNLMFTDKFSPNRTCFYCTKCTWIKNRVKEGKPRFCCLTTGEKLHGTETRDCFKEEYTKGRN